MRNLNVHGKFRFYQPEFDETGTMKRSAEGQALEEKRTTVRRLQEVVKRSKKMDKPKDKDGNRDGKKRKVVEVAEAVLQGDTVTEEEAQELETTATTLEQEVVGVDAPDEFRPNEVAFDLSVHVNPKQNRLNGCLHVRPIIDTPVGKSTHLYQTVRTRVPEPILEKVVAVIQEWLDDFS